MPGPRGEKKSPERTCIGCRGVFSKAEVVRIVAGPAGMVIDYREKLPGRAAYVCPRRSCIEQALLRDNVSRALRQKTKPVHAALFLDQLKSAVEERIRSLLAMSLKAGKVAAGFSAARDALDKGRLKLLLYACDLSEGTKEKLAVPESNLIREGTLFTREEYGKLFSRELVGIVGILDDGLADAIWHELQRLYGLINNGN